MKKKLFLMLLTSTVLTSALAGCGRNKKENTNDNANEDILATEEIRGEESGTEAVVTTEESVSQLGNAVEIPKGWDGKMAETDANEQLEKVIAEYCSVAEENYANVRYFYNYVDLNGDSKDEILALVFGPEIADGNMLLWIEDAENKNLTKDSVRQTFKQVGSPIYISNHMTEGHRDLIVADYVGTTGGEENAAQTRSVDSDTTRENATKQAQPKEDAAATEAVPTKIENTEGTNENGVEAISAGPQYKLIVWTGEKYQELEEGTVLENLNGYEGTAVITNDIESDFSNNTYHFLGEAMR